MTLSEEDQKEADRLLYAAWEKYYTPGTKSREAQAFKAAWAKAYYLGWRDGYLGHMTGQGTEDGPDDPDTVTRPSKRKRKLHKECACLCHLELGGGIHSGTKCLCNGGQGFDDGSDHVSQHDYK